MDFDRTKRRQSLKVIVSEAIMVLTVIITVIILALLVSGYWLNSDFEVERQGMLQISSFPTGADVFIDGESAWLQRTNTSKVLSSGEHTVLLTKEGYDTWSKTINISEGLLYRLHYPRLFATERTKEKFYDAVGVTQVFVDQGTILLYSGDIDALDTTNFTEPLSSDERNQIVPEWLSLDLNADVAETKPVNLKTLYDFFKQPETKVTTSIKDFALLQPLKGTEELVFSKFYEDNYLTVLDSTTVTVYQRDREEPVLSATLSFIPINTTAGHDGEFIVFSAGSQIATLDMETREVTEWSVDGDAFGWLGSDMLYSVKDGELFVYDYDGLNRRQLASNVSARFPVMIVHDKWLYYFSDLTLIRETISR